MDSVSLTRAQAKLVDKIAVEEFGIPSIVLMENAARSAAHSVKQTLRELSPAHPRVTVICGGGNNGGDGYALARHLHNSGAQVSVFSVTEAEKLSGDAAINRRIIERMKLKLSDVQNADQLSVESRNWVRADIIVDAILGTGFTGELRPHIAAVIKCVNRVAARNDIPVFAIDLPSGMDCDTGRVHEVAVTASYTVTFAAIKKGFENPLSRMFTGHVFVGSIGVPPELIARVTGNTDGLSTQPPADRIESVRQFSWLMEPECPTL